MQTYRFFFITAAGKIVAAEMAECADDAEAMTKGREFLTMRPTSHAIEIWDRARLVAAVSTE